MNVCDLLRRSTGAKPAAAALSVTVQHNGSWKVWNRLNTTVGSEGTITTMDNCAHGTLACSRTSGLQQKSQETCNLRHSIRSDAMS